MSYLEAFLALLVVAGLTYFAYTTVGQDEFPLNLAVAALALVVSLWLVAQVVGGGRR